MQATLQRLESIAEAKGQFSLDPLTHAKYTIEDMREIARAAIERAKQ